MQSELHTSSYSTTKTTNTTPVRHQDGNSLQLPGRIKIESIPHTEIQLSYAKMIANYQIKRENDPTEPLPQTMADGTVNESYLLAASNVHSTESAGESLFVSEIEIGATTIASQFEENVQIKREYSSTDEGSMEQQLMTDDHTTEHFTRTTDAENQSLPFGCEYCDASFVNLRQLNNHRRNHQLDMCPVCKKTIVARYLKEHVALNHPKSDALPQKRIYKCDQCEKLFYCKTLLIDHQRNHQTKECPYCKQMVKLRVLNMHIARKHSAIVSQTEHCTFPCDQCDRAFGTKALLVDHQRDHLSKNCPECGVKVLARCLKKHMARKHPPGGLGVKASRSYQCEQCDKTYSNKRTLIVHQAKHQTADEGKVV
uniref:C2H2-type domain-containing protein n=1 Tax=Anopheles coluzzii TaxID=1518534 RepID=A0A8W7PYN3_ANOCL